MLSIPIRRLVVCVVACLASVTVFGQGWPLPTAAGSTGSPVSCPGCPLARTNTADQLVVVVAPTMQWSDPIAAFTGRWLDSAFTQDFQQTFRTARAWCGIPVEANNRLYFMIGSSVAAYDSRTFFSRLESREMLTQGSALPVAGNTRPNDYSNERVLMWDKFFYIENTGVGWLYQIVDRQQTLWGYDVDDRGYVYLAAADEGWGMVRDDGTRDRGLMASVFQDLTFPTAKRITSLKGSGNKYYALLNDGMNPRVQVWDVTNPGLRTHIRDLDNDPGISAKGRDHSAAICQSVNLCIYANDDIVASKAPLTISGSGGSNFASVTTDGTAFYASFYNTKSKKWGLAILRPDANGVYSETDTVLPGFVIPGDMHYSSGYIALQGYNDLTGNDIYVIRMVDGTTPSLVTFNGFFAGYYQTPPAGYVAAHASAIYNAFPYVSNNKLYLVISAFTLGDAYQVRIPDCSAVVPPADITATATISKKTSVTVTWTPVPGADRYEVLRSSGGDYSLIGSIAGPPYVDSAVDPGFVYVYKARAIASTNGCVSPLSAGDVASILQFTDDPIVPGETLVKSVHFEELRSAIAQMRLEAGLSNDGLAGSASAGATINAKHLEDLRQALNEARNKLSLSQIVFTDSTLRPGSTTVRACHVNELRDALK